MQVALGYLALNPVARAEAIDGVDAAAPVGGTWVALEWHAGGALGGASRTDTRRRVAAAIDLSQLRQGLLGTIGAEQTSVLPDVQIVPAGRGASDLSGLAPPVIVVPKWEEATAYTGRALERELRAAGSGLDLYPLGTPEYVDAAGTQQDGVLRILRTTPRPALVTLAGSDRALMAAADAAPNRSEEVVTRALQAIQADASLVPLYRIGVTHAWRGVAAIRPSSWPGLGFWNVADWTRVPDGTGPVAAPSPGAS